MLPPRRPAAPAAGKQVAGIYRYKVGSIECTSINDGARRFPMPDNFVRNVPKPEALADLAAAGVDAKSIDVVLMSHLHPARTNAIRAADNSMAFPNAEIMVPGKDWEFSMSTENPAEAESNPMMKAYFANVQKVYSGIENKVTKHDWGKEIIPGITSIDANGHTPGHTAFVIAAGSSNIPIQSDVTNIPELFLRNPDWHVAFDVDPANAAETRHKFYDMAAAEKALIAGCHFTFPSLGHVEKDGAKYCLVPIAWNPVI